MHYPSHLQKLIAVLKQLPGVGAKTAERYAFSLLRWKKERAEDFARTLADMQAQLRHCETCGCLIDLTDCHFCNLDKRAKEQLCIVASPRDVFAIESTGDFRGLYHVLQGLLSPLEELGPEVLRLEALQRRLCLLPVKEIIIALDSTIEGDATALYLKEQLASPSLRISRLAFGLPMGSSLDYVDGGTLARAFSGRQAL